MINRTLSEVRALDKALVVIAGKCVGAGAADPTGQEGKGVAVTRSATGVYVITLPGKGTVIVRSAEPRVLGAAFRYCWVTAIDEAARTVTVKVTDTTSTAHDMTSSEELHYTIVMKNSSAP